MKERAENLTIIVNPPVDNGTLPSVLDQEAYERLFELVQANPPDGLLLYVATGFGLRNLDDMKRDVDKLLELTSSLDVHGFFLDEASANPDHILYLPI